MIWTAKHLAIFSSLFVGYVVFSVLRKTLASTWMQMRDDIGMTETDYGSIITNYALAYGISKLFGGVLSDVMSNRLLFVGGMFLSAICNLIISRSRSVTVIGSLWFVNGLLQGVGFPALGKILLKNFPKEMIGSLWGIISCVRKIIPFHYVLYK